MISREALADWATVMTGLCALVIGGLAVHQYTSSPQQGRSEDEVVEDWGDYLDRGHRIGPATAAVTIVEFGDYECPFCKQVEGPIRAVLGAFPGDVSLVYRHFPLSYHEHAYKAARIAECAAAQGRFSEAHRMLFDAESLGDIVLEDFGTSAAIEDLPAFVDCASREDPVATIERDLTAGRDLSVAATPTIVVNGLRLARTPDSTRLQQVVEAALMERGISIRD